MEPNRGDQRVTDMTASISAEVPIIQAGSDSNKPPTTARASATIHVDLAASSFETFYRDQRDSIARALALTIGDVDQAADSTDEAMIRAYQRWHDVAHLDKPAAWVYRVGLNHSRSRFRRVARKLKYTRRVTRDEVVHHDQPFADRFADDEMAAALENLPDAQRAVVVVRVLLGFSEREAVRILNVKPGTVKSRLHRALTSLRDELPHLAAADDDSSHHY